MMLIGPVLNQHPRAFSMNVEVSHNRTSNIFLEKSAIDYKYGIKLGSF